MANGRMAKVCVVAALLLAILGGAPTAGADPPATCTASMTPDPLQVGQSGHLAISGLGPDEQIDYLFHQVSITGSLPGTSDGAGMYSLDSSFSEGTYDFTFTGHTSGTTCDLHFDVLPDPDPLVLTVTVDRTDLTVDHHGVTVSGTFACNHDGFASGSVNLSQNIDGPSSGSGYLEDRACGSAPTPWQVTLAPRPARGPTGRPASRSTRSPTAATARPSPTPPPTSPSRARLLRRGRPSTTWPSATRWPPASRPDPVRATSICWPSTTARAGPGSCSSTTAAPARPRPR